MRLGEGSYSTHYRSGARWWYWWEQRHWATKLLDSLIQSPITRLFLGTLTQAVVDSIFSSLFFFFNDVREMSVSCRGPSERTLFLDEAKLLAITASWGHSTHLLTSYHLFIFLFHFQFSKMFSLFLNLAMSAKLSLFTFYRSLLRVWVHQSIRSLHHLDGLPLHFFFIQSVLNQQNKHWSLCNHCLAQMFPTWASLLRYHRQTGHPLCFIFSFFAAVTSWLHHFRVLISRLEYEPLESRDPIFSSLYP